MGRSYAKVYRDVWADADFCRLGPEARYTYLFLLSQPDLNAAGVLPLTVRRWAVRAGITLAAMEGAIATLDDHEFVVTDTGTEELLVRTFVRNDGLWRIPNTLYAVVRDAERTVSPTLRATLAAELGSLPVDELTGKRSAEMKAQLSTVTATLRATVAPRVGASPGMRVRVRDAGAGGSSGSEASVENQSSRRYARACEDPDLIEFTMGKIRDATGKDVEPGWARRVLEDLIGSRDVADPAAYIAAAIRAERDPRTRFLPVAASLPAARSVTEAVFAAGIEPGQRPASPDTVRAAAEAVRAAITRTDEGTS